MIYIRPPPPWGRWNSPSSPRDHVAHFNLFLQCSQNRHVFKLRRQTWQWEKPPNLSHKFMCACPSFLKASWSDFSCLSLQPGWTSSYRHQLSLPGKIHSLGVSGWFSRMSPSSNLFSAISVSQISWNLSCPCLLGSIQMVNHKSSMKSEICSMAGSHCWQQSWCSLSLTHSLSLTWT